MGDLFESFFKLIGENLKPLASFFKSNAGLITVAAITVVLWIGFLNPAFIEFFKLDKLPYDIGPWIGVGVILFTTIFMVLLILRVADGISRYREEKKRGRDVLREEEKRESDVRQIFDDLSRPELLYLAQYLRHGSTLIAFDAADPVVRLLEGKGMIYPETSLDYPPPSFNVRFGIGETFRILPSIYEYLLKNRQLFEKLSRQPQAD